MEWTPSDKMSITDLRAVLASWDVPSLSNDKGVLAKEVSDHYREIMLARSNRRPAVPSFVYCLPLSFAPSCVARSSGGSHKAGGTDTPAMVTSYIGSEGAVDDDKLDGHQHPQPDQHHQHQPRHRCVCRCARRGRRR